MLGRHCVHYVRIPPLGGANGGVDAIVRELGRSAEYRTGNRMFVHASYEDLLERGRFQLRATYPSIAEVDYWTGRLNSGSMSRPNVANYFINTAEFVRSKPTTCRGMHLVR